MKQANTEVVLSEREARRRAAEVRRAHPEAEVLLVTECLRKGRRRHRLVVTVAG